jgi:hypothetical protein
MSTVSGVPGGGGGVRSKVCAIDLPAAFDAAAYDAVSPIMARLTSRNDGLARSKSAYQTFASAWNGVGYRITATVQYDVDFRAALAAGGSGPAGAERFNQERALFGCATSSVSAIDCFYMASYAVAASIPSALFPLDIAKRLKKYPPDVAALFDAAFPCDAFTSMAAEAANSKEFDALKDVRDVLSHRGTLLRSHFVSVGGATPSYAAHPSNPKELAEDFDYSQTLSDDTTRIHAHWTLSTLNKLVVELRAFIERREAKLPPLAPIPAPPAV